MNWTYNYIIANKGIESETTYPYKAHKHKCKYNATNSAANVTAHVELARYNETLLKVAVATVGPISVAIDANHNSFFSYSSGVYNEKACSSKDRNLDHAVLVVGYGTTDKNVDYWIVKNSWGPEWGNEGYIWMSRNNKNQCGITDAAIYPIVG